MLILAIFIAVLGAVLLRPRWLNEGVAAMIGAAAVIVTGGLSFAAARTVVTTNWNVLLFFLGMMTITTLAESAGFFEWLSLQAARQAHGSSRRLYLNVFLIGVLISTFLTNDATALILTPVIYTLVSRLRLDPVSYMFACTFIADTASMTLPISNPINILVADSWQLPLGGFLHYLLLPSLAAIIINICAFLWRFKRALRQDFAEKQLPSLEDVVPDQRLFQATAAVLCVLAIAFIIGAARNWPTGLVALGGAIAMVAVRHHRRKIKAIELGKGISWSIFPFICGMFILVQAIESVGLTNHLTQLLADGMGHGPLVLALVAVGISALGSNIINNVPMVLVMNAATHSVQAAPAILLPYATIIGCDLGPNITTTGSLATMLWLLLLRNRGMNISSLQYFKQGAIITPVMLVISAILLGIGA